MMVAFAGLLIALPAAAQSIARVAINTGSPPAGDTTDHRDLRIGDRYALEGRAFDAAGREISGVRLTWKSGNPTVASISTAGVITARARGYATITGTAGGQSVTVRMCVLAPGTGYEQLDTSIGPITQTPATTVLAARGATIQQVAHVQMLAREIVSRSIHSGPCVHWYLDPRPPAAVATIDRAGVLHCWRGCIGVMVGAQLGGPFR